MSKLAERKRLDIINLLVLLCKKSTPNSMKKKGLDQLISEDVANPETPGPKIWPEFTVKPAEEGEGKLPTLHTFVRKQHEGKYYLFPIVYSLAGYNEEAGPTQYDETRVQVDVDNITRLAIPQPGRTIEDPNQEA